MKRLPPAYVRTQTSEEFRFVPLPQLADKTPRQTFLKYLAGCSVAPLLFFTAVCVHGIAVFPILADVVDFKTRSRSTAHWSNDFIRLSAWRRNSFAQLITPLDIDGIGQNWEDSNTWAVWGMCHTTQLHRACAGRSFQTGAGQNFPRLTVLAVP